MTIVYRLNGVQVTKEEWDASKKVGIDFSNPFYAAKPMSYISPMSGKEITCPKQRKEEMKKYGVREVDPSEYRSMLRDRGFDERSGQ